MTFGILTHNYLLDKGKRKNAGVFVYDFNHALVKTLGKTVPLLFYNFEGKKSLNNRKSDVTIFTPDGISKKPGNWNRYSPLSLYYFLKTMHDAKIQTESFVKKKKISFLLACWALPSGLIAYHIKKQLGIPYAIWCLGSDITLFTKIPILKTMIVRSLLNASIIFVNSHSLGLEVTKITGRKTIFLPAVTEFEEKTTKILSRKKKTYYLLYVGRLEKVKGIDILIKSLTFINPSDYNIVLWIGGEGSLSNTIRQQVAQAKFAHTVEILGNLNQEKVSAYMNSADLLIIPSRNESLPLVLIEAGKLGLPSVVTDVGDSARFVQKHSAGIITKPNNPNSLAAGISQAISDLPKLRNIARKRKKLLKEKFTPEKTAELFNDYVTKII